MKLLLLIVARNEEDQLGGCIDHIRHLVDEVVVVVQESTDRTLEIALEKADKVLEHPVMGSCEFSRREGVDLCSGDWIIALDADERLSRHGQGLLRGLMVWNVHEVYALRRLTTVDGVTTEDAFHYRMFRPEDWDRVHNRMHSSFHPRDGVPIRPVGGPPFIEHFKSGQRQATQTARYHEWGYLRTEMRPEWEVVPWSRRLK